MTFKARPLGEAENAFIRAALDNGGSLSAAYRTAFPHVRANPAQIARLAGRLARRRPIAVALGRAANRQRQAVERAMERFGLTQDSTCELLAKLAVTELREVMDVRTIGKDGERVQQIFIFDFKEIAPSAHVAIHRVRQTKEGITVELADRIAAIRTLAQIRGWIKQEPPPANQQMVLFKVVK